jgi:hypothetical protein
MAKKIEKWAYTNLTGYCGLKNDSVTHRFHEIHELPDKNSPIVDILSVPDQLVSKIHVDFMDQHIDEAGDVWIRIDNPIGYMRILNHKEKKYAIQISPKYISVPS